MDASIKRVIEHIERYAEAGDRLIERLELQRRWNLEDVERLKVGATIGKATKATRSADRSRDLTRILSEFEQSRREIRAAVVVAALEEGLSISEIAEIFGVSRQLANRFARDAHALLARAERSDATG